MRKPSEFLWLVSAVLALASLACSLGAAPSAPAATPARFEPPPARTQPATPVLETALPHTGATASAAASSPLQTPASKQPDEPATLPATAASLPTETPAPELTATSAPAIDVALQSELFFSTGGFIYYGCDKLIPPEAAQGPVVMGLERLEVSFMGGDMGALCLFGFPLQGRLVLELASPDGQTMAARYNIVESTFSPGLMQLNQLKPFQAEGLGVGGVKDGISYIQVPLYWPVGLRTGKWRAHAKIGDTVAEASFRIPRFSDPHISIVSEQDISPFNPAGCAVFSQGQSIRVNGSTFPKDQAVPVGFYWRDPDTKAFKLLATQAVQAGGGGAFQALFTIDSSMPLGSYDLVAVTDPNAKQIYYAGAWACFTVQ